MKRGDAMDEAKRIITKDRQQTHGRPEDTFGMIAEFWSTYLGMHLLPHDVAALMNLMKVARIASNPFHEDNWVDGAGYMGCGVELATELTSEELDRANEAIEYQLTEEGGKALGKRVFKSGESFVSSMAYDYDPANTVKVSLHTSPITTQQTTSAAGYAAGGVKWTQASPVTVTNIALFDSSIDIDDEDLDAVEEAFEQREKSKRAFYKMLRKQYPWLPADAKKMKHFHIWHKDGEITGEKRWFVGLHWEEDGRDRYSEFYLHGYEQWVMTVQNPDDGEGDAQPARV